MRITIGVASALVLTSAAVIGMIAFERQRVAQAQEQQVRAVEQLRAAERVRINVTANEQETPRLAQAGAGAPPTVYELAPPGPNGTVGVGRLQAVQAVPYPPVAGGWGPGDPETGELTSQDQQLEQEVQSLVRQLADSSDDKQRGELKDKLAATLEKQFDAQQKLRELEVSRIEARVQKLRDVVKKRTDSRRKIIENRLEQLLNDADGLGWNAAGGHVNPYAPQALPGVMAPSITPGGTVPPSAPTPRKR